MISLILLVFAFVLCLVEAFRGVPWPGIPQFGWLGLALYFLSLILTGAGLR